MTQFLVPFEAGKLHQGIKFHFTQAKYDFHKYRGEVKGFTKEKFENDGRNWPFQKLARKYDADKLKWFYVANIMEKPKRWPGELLQKDAHDTYLALVAAHERMGYQFREEYTKLLDTYGSPIDKILTGDPPALVKMFYRKEITTETMVILNSVLDGKLWDVLTSQMSDTVLWPKQVLKLKKYEAFLDIDKAKFRGVITSVGV